LFLVNLYCLYASSVIVCLFHVFLLYISVCLSVLLFLYCFFITLLSASMANKDYIYINAIL